LLFIAASPERAAGFCRRFPRCVQPCRRGAETSRKQPLEFARVRSQNTSTVELPEQQTGIISKCRQCIGIQNRGSTTRQRRRDKVLCIGPRSAAGSDRHSIQPVI
jgi:hypothetical protein